MAHGFYGLNGFSEKPRRHWEHREAQTTKGTKSTKVFCNVVCWLFLLICFAQVLLVALLCGGT